MISFDNLKSIANILKEAGKIDQYQQILDAQAKMLEMQSKIAELENKNKDLQEKLKIKENLIYENNCYWSNNNGKKDGPFCSRCWDKDKITVRMHPNGNPAYYYCPACKNSVQVYPDTSSAIVNIGSDIPDFF